MAIQQIFMLGISNVTQGTKDLILKHASLWISLLIGVHVVIPTDWLDRQSSLKSSVYHTLVACSCSTSVVCSWKFCSVKCKISDLSSPFNPCLDGFVVESASPRPVLTPSPNKSPTKQS